jgi:hypothetical protein
MAGKRTLLREAVRRQTCWHVDLKYFCELQRLRAFVIVVHQPSH